MSENITELDSSNFEAAISASVPVVVDFWAPWCGPCKAIAPILEELAAELGDAVKICKVNVDNNSEIAGKFEIRAIPTILVFKDGAVSDTIVGLTWQKISQTNACPWFDRVDTKSKPVDGLSRCDLQGNCELAPLEFPGAELSAAFRRARRYAPS